MDTDTYCQRIDGYANKLADERDRADEQARLAGERRADEIAEINRRIRLLEVDDSVMFQIVTTLVCKARDEGTMHTIDLDAIEEAICDLGGVA